MNFDTHTNEPCHTSEYHVTHLNESWHTDEWVMSHIRMSHGTFISESCHTYE